MKIERVMTGLSLEDLCDLMCGPPEQDEEDERMYECFHCGKIAVIWDSDFDFDDFGYEGKGIVHMCHCTECGAEIEYRVAIPDEEDEDASQKS